MAACVGLVLLMVLLCRGVVSSSAASMPQEDKRLSKTFIGNENITIHIVQSGPYRYRRGGCTLKTVYPVRDTLDGFLKAGAKLVEMDLSLLNYPPNFLNHRLPGYFRPHHWVRSTGRQGRRLLVLEDNHDFMSMFFLSIGVEQMKVTLTDSPKRCLRSLTSEDVLNALRELLLSDFKTNVTGSRGGSLSRDEHVCNVRVENCNGTAHFVYTCCHKSPDGDVICDDVGYDIWMETLMMMIFISKILAMLYSPAFLPSGLYEPKPYAGEYIYRLSSSKRVKLQLRIFPKGYRHGQVVRLSRMKDMEVLNDTIQCVISRRSHLEDLTCVVNCACLKVKSSRVLTENEVPVSLSQTVYKNIVQCRLRQRRALRPCCQQYVCDQNWTCCLPPLQWYKLLKKLVNAVVVTLCIVPWVIRVWVFYRFEEEVMAEKHEAASKLGLWTEYQGITLFLTPVHTFFIVVYVIFAVDSLVYSLMNKAMKEKMIYAVRECLRAMKRKSQITVCTFVTRLFLFPFESCGLLGILLFFPYLVGLLVVMGVPFVIYLFPALNLTTRLLVSLFVHIFPKQITGKIQDTTYRTFEKLWAILWPYDEAAEDMVPDRQEPLVESPPNRTFKEKPDAEFRLSGADRSYRLDALGTRYERPLQVIVIIMCLVSFWSVSLLLMEVVSFIVEMGVYTLMGIITNAGSILQYITVFVLVFVYAKSELRGLYDKYLTYHKAIHRQLRKLGKKEIDEVAKEDELNQVNTAFCLEDENKDNIRLVTRDGKMYWETKSMLVFLDNKDTPYTPSEFFYKSIAFNCCGSPGPLAHSAIAALKRFGFIFLFLVFVFIVVMAFGDTYRVSTTSQLLATVAGGLVPLLFRYIIISSSSSPSLDGESVQFTMEFEKARKVHQEEWPVFDIVPIGYKDRRLRTDNGDGQSEGEETKETHSTDGEPDKDAGMPNGGAQAAVQMNAPACDQSEYVITIDINN